MESKYSSLHFLAHFSTDQDENWCSVEAVQVEYSDAALVWDLRSQGTKKSFNVAIRSYIYELICFKQDVMIGTFEFNTLMLV